MSFFRHKSQMVEPRTPSRAGRGDGGSGAPSRSRHAAPPASRSGLTGHLRHGLFLGGRAKFWVVDGVYRPRSATAAATPRTRPTRRSARQDRSRRSRAGRLRPGEVSYEQLLSSFWESHDPTQRHAPGNDVGTQYRLPLYDELCCTASLAAAVARRVPMSSYRRRLRPDHDRDPPAGPFYYAEDYHQQYLEGTPPVMRLGGPGVALPGRLAAPRADELDYRSLESCRA